jgi:hypothetical protein
VKTIGRVILEGIWQASRYILATSIVASVVAVLPILAAVIVTLVGGICAIAISILLMGGAITGASDPPIFAMLLAVIVPIGFVIAVIILFIAVIGADLLFVGLLVLPVALLTDIILHHTRVRSTIVLVAGFLLAGGLVGAIACTLWVVLNSQANGLIVGIAGGLLFSVCTVSVGLFGFALTMTETAKGVLITLWKKMTFLVKKDSLTLAYCGGNTGPGTHSH